MSVYHLLGKSLHNSSIWLIRAVYHNAIELFLMFLWMYSSLAIDKNGGEPIEQAITFFLFCNWIRRLSAKRRYNRTEIVSDRKIRCYCCTA